VRRGCVLTAAFSLLAALIVTTVIRVGGCWHERVLLVSVLFAAALSISFELLSLLDSLTFQYVRIALAASIGAGVVFAIWISRTNPEDAEASSASGSASGGHGYFSIEFLISAVIFVLLAAACFTAVSSTPNNWDSMTYHLPRIEHWLQNRNLDHYPTSIGRQLDSNILAEELILAARSAVDAYPVANLVQWICFAGCILVAGEICRLIGGSALAQGMTQLAVATLPMAILQASSTQNDLVVAFFAATCVFFVLRLHRSHAEVFLIPAILAAALAFHAKGTAIPFLLGFALIYGSAILIRRQSSQFWLNGAASLALAGLILGGFLSRNLLHYGSLVAPSSAITQISEPSWRATLLNAVRNIGSNLYLPGRPEAPLVTQTVSFVQSSLGVPAPDSRYSFLSLPFDAAGTYNHEDFGPNTLHTLLFVVVLLFGTFSILTRRMKSPEPQLYWLACLISAIAFCTIVRWQPWIVRLQLGGFVLLAPIVMLTLSRIRATLIGAGLLLISIPAILLAFVNDIRPIVGERSVVTSQPEQILFANRKDLRVDYVELADRVAGLRPKRVSVVVGSDGWEFPLWYLLGQRLPAEQMPVIVHALDETRLDPASDLFVYIDAAPAPARLKAFERLSESDHLSLYRRRQPEESQQQRP